MIALLDCCMSGKQLPVWKWNFYFELTSQIKKQSRYIYITGSQSVNNNFVLSVNRELMKKDLE